MTNQSDPSIDPARFEEWAGGYGVVRHQPATVDALRRVIAGLAQRGLQGDGDTPVGLCMAADRLANAAMALVAHMSYAKRVRLDGEPLLAEDFKENPQGHTGGSLNMVPAYLGYLLANALTGNTRAWTMGQGHAVAAIDSVNVLVDNMRAEHAARYDASEAGLSRFVADFYSYRLDAGGHQESPLGSHVNVNTAGGTLEGGYLGFVDLQYVHMPLPGEQLVAFLSDGAFEEQRGSDWAPRWWRAEDCGLVLPIMIFNGRRIDQRSTMSQGQGLPWFLRHLRNYSFEPMVIDGTDPVAFACLILESEWLLLERSQRLLAGADKYPVLMPYGVAVAEKGAGFYGAGTNDAHGLPLGANPAHDALARNRFNASARLLHVPDAELAAARAALQGHALSSRIRERDHPLAERDVRIQHWPELPFRPVPQDRRNPTFHGAASPMDAVDQTFLAYVRANPGLRARVGNPDEMRSNRMNATLDVLKHRVTEPEAGVAEALDGKVITALNEEAVVCACLGNKAGINLVVTYEAFGPKMLGAVRQDVIWSDHLRARGREPGWLSVPVVLSSHTYENGKNERSHQDPGMAEAMLGEPSDISRVIFPADHNTAVAAVDACFRSRGRIFTMVVPKSEVADLFTAEEAQALLASGAMRLPWTTPPGTDCRLLLTAIGAFQLHETQVAAERLAERGVPAAVNYMIEPGRFRDPRGRREAACQVGDTERARLYPESVGPRVFAGHIRPEALAGLLRPLDSGRQSIFLGYTNHGGTLDTAGMLFVNRLSWAHVVRAAVRVLGADLAQFLDANEVAALEGRRSPHGVIL